MGVIIPNSFQDAIPQSYFLNSYRYGMDKHGFGKRLLEICEERNVSTTQSALGKFLGVSGTSARAYLQGEKTPSMVHAIEFAEKLGVCVEWLLTGRGGKYPERRNAAMDVIDISDLSPSSKAAVKTLVHALKDSVHSTAQSS